MKTKFQAFGVPIETFFKFPDNILVYWKNTHSIFYGCNDILATLGCLASQHIVGTKDIDFMDADCALQIVENDNLILNTKKAQVFLETPTYRNNETHQLLSFKTLLKNSSGQTKGIFGFSIMTDNSCLSQISNLIQKLKLTQNLLPPLFFTPTEKQKKLTPKEKQCIYYLVKGYSMKETARALNNSPRTIETHLEHIKEKLGVYTRAQIIEQAFEERLMS